LQKTIQSVKNQTFKEVEVWVVDGGSSEETQTYLHELNPPFFYQSEKDGGIYDAMNKGVELSKGEWLYFLGSGDGLYNDRVLETVFSNPVPEQVSLIAGKIIYEGDTKPFIYSKHKRVQTPSWSFSIWLRNSLHHQGTLYRRSLFLNNSFNLAYKIVSDYWFNLLLFKNKEHCFIVDLMLAKCNSNGVSKSGSWQLYKEEIKLKMNHSSMVLFPFFFCLAFVKFLTRKLVHGFA
jgi:glycosyltransferase involved in cell wall biosynthesis